MTPETAAEKTSEWFTPTTWLLIVGLVLFNLGCFAAPDFPERGLYGLDVRFWPLWYFGIMAVLVAVSIYRFRKSRTSHVLWIACALIVGIRCCSDLAIYDDGMTVTVRRYSPEEYDYLVHFPKGHSDFEGRRPLLVFLHGAGETGQDVSVLRKLDIYHYAHGKIPAEEFPFLVVSPMTPKHDWEPAKVVHLVETLLADPRFGSRIDPDRIYLTGFSMGGFGTFRTAIAFPDRFAAIVPLAGGGEPEAAPKLQTTPTWAFHGDVDDVVSYDCTKNMIDAMEKLDHQNAKLTTLHGAGHGIPEMVYTRRDLYRWLLQKKRNDKH